MLINIARSRCAQCARRYSTSTTSSRYADVVSNAELQKALSEYNEKMSQIRKEYAVEAEKLGANGPPKERAKAVQKEKTATLVKKRKEKNVKSIGEAPMTEIPLRQARPIIPKAKGEAINASSSAREERLHHLTNLFHLAGGSSTSDSFSNRLGSGIVPPKSSQESGRHSKGFITNYAELDDRIAAEFGKDGENLVHTKPYRDGVNVTSVRISGDSSEYMAENFLGSPSSRRSKQDPRRLETSRCYKARHCKRMARGISKRLRCKRNANESYRRPRVTRERKRGRIVALMYHNHSTDLRDNGRLLASSKLCQQRQLQRSIN